MKRILSLLLVGLVVASAGCISFGEGGAVILNFRNETYTFTLPENSTNTTTPAPGMHVYEKQVIVGQKLVIQELNFEIAPDYDANKGKFFFVTTNGVYWEPMNITLEDGTNIAGGEYWVGSTSYVAKITITSPQELTILIQLNTKEDTNTPVGG